MHEKTVNISGIDVRFRASAATPRIYRAKFKRDIFKDFAKLEESYNRNSKTKNAGSAMGLEDLEVFENVAYVMAFQADPSIPADIDIWLDQFEVFSVYEVLPDILTLWGDNVFTMSQDAGKKNGVSHPVR